ncbi:H(+)-transporting V1 sector ATPase subunit A [Haplosporangium gracile]|nr:H(+)-transporting V1 sector ATPase subunit A [Haplosporangium gracile]
MPLQEEKRKAVDAQNKKNSRPRRILIEDEEQGKEAEEGNNKRTLLDHDEDDDENQGSSTPIAVTESSSHSWSAKGREKIESQGKSFASKTLTAEKEEDDIGVTTYPDVPWSLFANKNSILVLGDGNGEDGDDVHNNDDDFWPDMSYSDTDSSGNKSADETEIDGARSDTVPVMLQAHESNQYGEMLGRAAEFGKPYLSHGDHERQTTDTFKEPSMDSSKSAISHLGSSYNRAVLSSVCGTPGTSRSRTVSGKTIKNSDGGIPGTPSASGSMATTTTTNGDRQEMTKVQKRFHGSGGSGEKSGFNRVRSLGKTSKKGGKGHMSDPDDDDESTTDPSDSENDDAPNIDMGFGDNTRVFMANGTTKRIKKIQPGEYVLGPDRLPRLVTGTSAGHSPMIQVRELTQNVAYRPDDYFGLVTFTCTPKQALRLATAQMQGVRVGHDNKFGLFQVSFRRLKRVQEAMVVVHSSKSFQDSLPNARQRADAFAHNQSKDVIYWTLPKDRHDLVSAEIQLQTYHLTAALDFEIGHLRYHALKSGFTDDIGMPEKLAYIWGTWIGDGDSIRTAIAVNRKDKEQIARIEDVCYDLGLAARLYKLSEADKARNNMGGRVSIVGRAQKRCNYFMTFLRRLGFGKSGSKHLPRWLRKESISVREHFLAGLIDSDGCCAKQSQQFVRNDYGATPHDRDKSSQRRTYKEVPIATIYPKIAEGVFILTRSLGIPYAVTYDPAKTKGHGRSQQVFRVRLQPCRALTNVLSLCAVDTKWQPAPVTFIRHHIEYRYGSFNQDLVAAIHKLPDLPLVLLQNPEETRALIRQLDYPTLSLLAKRYHSFGYSHNHIRERLRVSFTVISAYLANKGNNKKLENFMRDQLFQKMPAEEIHPLVLLTRNPPRHHSVTLRLDPASDGLFVLGNNVIVASRE